MAGSDVTNVVVNDHGKKAQATLEGGRWTAWWPDGQPEGLLTGTFTGLGGRPLIEAFGLLARPLPIESPVATVNCNWHQRYDSDPAHAWLREQVRASIEEITAC